jgi:hypothetical protein
MSSMPNELIIRKVLGPWYVSGKQYHSPLPPDLDEWYCYPSDSGHSILCVLQGIYKGGEDPTDYMVPVPVKAVLRRYILHKGFVFVDLPYDPELGLITEEGDDEY